MKTTNSIRTILTVGLGILLFACGKSGGITGPSVSNGFQESAGGIFLAKGGTKLGTLYIEGSCDGSDNAGQNVTSLGSRNGKLRARSTGCVADIAFNLEVREISQTSIELFTTITSISGGLRTVSIPLDTLLNVFPTDRTGYGFSGNRSFKGCETRGSFSDIPQPCSIPNAGPVGLVADLDPYRWGKLIGPVATIQREYMGGNCSRLLFFRHPSTNNIEVGFRIGSDGVILHSGQTLTCNERITIF